MTEMESRAEVSIPDDVSLDVAKGTVTVSGEHGEVERDLFHPLITISEGNDTVVLEAERERQHEQKLLHTYQTHVKNMIRGVTEGITYKLQICASHFPMNVSCDGSTFTVENYLGERTPRELDVPTSVDITIEDETVIVEGADKEQVGQTAASIERLASRTGFDRRVFQDGIYITEKDGRKLV